MDIRYDPGLLDEAVTREILRREAAGEAAWLAEYHRVADALYGLDAATRAGKFEQVQAALFRRLGLAAVVERVAGEFPDVAAAAATMILAAARGAADEEADLLGAGETASGPRRNSQGSSSTAQCVSVRVRIQVDRFAAPEALEGFLRHELGHVRDMLRPDFGYRRDGRIAERPIEESLVRCRLRLLWNLRIAGAIERSGRRGAAPRGEWERVAAGVYPFLAAGVRDRIVASLWCAAALTYPELAGLARDPASLLAFAGVAGEAPHGPAPGAACPLCGFPTYDWAGGIAATVAGAIAADFPSWGPAQGACGQCVGGYAARRNGRERVRV